MKNVQWVTIALLSLGCVLGTAQAHDPIKGGKTDSLTQAAHNTGPAPQEVREFVEQLAKDNNQHLQTLSKEKLKTYVEDQSPRATVVSCSDSRVQSDAYHQNPINDLFYVRNIGNQIVSTEGSVEYGVNHLKTPVLLIIGHSQCGAIHAAMSDYSKESKAIKKELDTLDLLKGNDTDEGVMANIHNQVNYAVNKFKDKVTNKDLAVIGVIYDFRNDYGHGNGKMIVIDVNGDTDAERLRAMPLLANIPDIAIGEKRLKSAPVPAVAPIPAHQEAATAPAAQNTPANTDPKAAQNASENTEPKKVNFKFSFDMFKTNKTNP